MSLMEQYLLQLPKRLAQEVRAGIANGDAANVDMISGADNKHFTLQVNGKEYPAKIAQLPCILETHKTYDDNFFYKSGEIGQIFVVTDKEEEKKTLEAQEEIPNGITPPNTNVVKRKYEKTKKTTPFPKNDVSRVEEDLVKISAGGAFEDVHEELVDFYDWMATDEQPQGIIVTDEMELIREHPEYLTLSEEPPDKKQKVLPPTAGASTVPGTASASAITTPLATDVGSEAESQGDGRASVQRSPAFAPTPSPRLSPMQLNSQTGDQDEDKEVDMLEDDILDGLETKPAEPPSQAYLTDPEYLKLMPIRDRLQKSVRDADRDISELSAKVDANSNIVVKVGASPVMCYDPTICVRLLTYIAFLLQLCLSTQNRFKQMLENARKQRNEISAELDKVQAEIVAFESS
ncbi:transcription initiation factor TFIID subunit 7 [Phytophthora boehmeriae]|uniref:Transcription initiation factor TFIID subunit 7 n=1 Tax=Phytophthora boehmeriae TaxID=109152 RepID=A0A8T1WI42_9STRA|nr:transcription initiation factor TFIID subunit 7 [Phytophthora boehmeriae]